MQTDGLLLPNALLFYNNEFMLVNPLSDGKAHGVEKKGEIDFLKNR